MNENEFATGSVPVMVAARIYGKDASWVRAGIISGWLPIGKATRNGQLVTKIEDMNSKYGRINFYISPKRLYEETEKGWSVLSDERWIWSWTSDERKRRSLLCCNRFQRLSLDGIRDGQRTWQGRRH